MQGRSTLIADLGTGQYELVVELDRDDTCSIWAGLCHSSDADRVVRISRLRRKCVQRPALRSAFVRDARVAKRVRAAHIVGVIEAGNAGESAYLAAEMIGSVTLAEIIEAASRLRQPLPMPALVRIAIDVARALTAMHRTPSTDNGPAVGIAHGDLTPSSILISPDGRVRVVPTGLGRVACHPAAPRSIERLRYKAPEQVIEPSLTRDIDPRVDVFAFGALMWEAFVGRPAFEGGDDQEIIEAVARAKVPALAEETDSSFGLSYVLERAMQRDPADRFGDGAELHGALVVLERRLQRGLTARRKYSAIAPKNAADPGRQALVEMFQRLVGPEYIARRQELELMLGARI